MRRCMIPGIIGLALLVGACGSASETTAGTAPVAATTDPAMQKRLDKLEKEGADARRDALEARQKVRRAQAERAKARRAKVKRAKAAKAARAEANTTPAPEPASGGGGITVPNVVGLDHQAAQNAMQGEGLYNLDEKDCSGQNRLLLFDRNWEVVSTSPAGGSSVSEDTQITICSVKQGE